MLLNFLNNEEGGNISKNSEIERHGDTATTPPAPHFGKEPDQVTPQPQQRQANSHSTPWKLGNASRMALAGLLCESNRLTPDDVAERVARWALRPPPLF
jgi:hypothetical protein